VCGGLLCASAICAAPAWWASHQSASDAGGFSRRDGRSLSRSRPQAVARFLIWSFNSDLKSRRKIDRPARRVVAFRSSRTTVSWSGPDRSTEPGALVGLAGLLVVTYRPVPRIDFVSAIVLNRPRRAR
jgi:hypothetical protein